ncbi:metallophosphoesterase [Motilibacter deserti]|uniref:Metallophosphoesterase n=1 Tax=Motilibacter deserti TaxID=2714956 RepID=A0ABX0GZY6_9ACTN|nr:metallophosphoesterase [Motilibacter deserti]NHC15226.1 metallophosphoesterase [Motilibacter deserti]
MQPLAPSLARVALAAAGIAAAGAAYSAGYEVRSFRLRRVEVPVLPAGQRPLRVLHLSDLHVLPRQRRKVEWVRRLAALEPDLVVDTGDNLAGLDAVPAALDALGPLLEKPGVFVFGSNDYTAPSFRNPAVYLRRGGSSGPDDKPRRGIELPWQDLRDALSDAGWVDLNNARAQLTVDGRDLELVGVDDPHIGRDRYAAVGGPADPAADLLLGVAHAPYRRVLDAMSADGARLVLAGHTHGGQLRVPLSPASLVTNCDLPRWQARGLSRWGGSWLHVSAGLGTSPYVPLRFACPPEATLLTLVAA